MRRPRNTSLDARAQGVAFLAVAGASGFTLEPLMPIESVAALPVVWVLASIIGLVAMAGLQIGADSWLGWSGL